MTPVRRTITVDSDLWERFESAVVRRYGKYKGAMSESVEEAIRFWLDFGDLEKVFEEMTEYLHWVFAITCRLWVDGKRDEATILAEALRRITSRAIRRAYPRVVGLELLATVFVESQRKSDLIVNDLRCYPWSLVCPSEDGFIVRLIINRCIDDDGNLVCGSDKCPCENLEDCENVEAEEKVSTIDDALDTLAKLYLSYFFSERALADGIRSRIEIDESYWEMKKELERRGILLQLGARDEKKIEELRRRKRERQREMHAKLMEIITRVYGEELPKRVDEWLAEEREKSKRFFPSDEFTARIWLRGAIDRLDILHIELKSIYEKAKRKGMQEVCGKTLELFESAWKHLFPLTRDPTKLKEALDKLKDLLELLKRDAVVLVKTDIDEDAVSYSDVLYDATRQLVKAIAAIERYLER